MQSGSDEVLKLMRRRYDTALFASKVKRIKEVMPDAFIGVDVIVGTRGETEEYFEQAYRFIQSLDVTQLHVFSYGCVSLIWITARSGRFLNVFPVLIHLSLHSSNISLAPLLTMKYC